MSAQKVIHIRNEKMNHFQRVIDGVREYFIFCNVNAGTRYMIATFIWKKGIDATPIEISAALQILKKNTEITFEKNVWFAIAIK